MKTAILLLIIVLLAYLVTRSARRGRSERQAAAQRATRLRARRNQVPHVSANLRGLDAGGRQTTSRADHPAAGPRSPGRQAGGFSQLRDGESPQTRAPSSARRKA
jgi:predicted amidohydrolase